MDITVASFIISVLAILVSFGALLRKPAIPQNSTTSNTEKAHFHTMQLHAYERLVLLCERIALPNLISRTASSDLSAREMQYILIENIKQEFDYNASQQIYVSPSAWSLVRDLRDQTILIINRIADGLSPNAVAADLNKQLLEVIMSQEDNPMHIIVLEALNSEAKKLMR